MKLKIKVDESSAYLQSAEGKLTTGMVGAVAEFTFSSVWDGLHKIAVFRAGNAVKEVENIDSSASIPVEVLVEHNKVLEVGVYGFNDVGDIVIPTVYVRACKIHEGADPVGNVSTALPFYAKLQKQIDNIRNILSEAKDELLSVISQHLPLKGGSLSGSLTTRDVRVGGGVNEETGKWEPGLGKGRSSLEVSGTTRLHGEVYAEDSSFHVKALDVGNEARIKGSLTVDNETRIHNSLRVDSELQCDGRLKLKGDLDMKGNDIRHAQSIQVEGTSDFLGDVKIKNNTNRDYTLKLSDVLNEALDYKFKSRVYLDKMEGDNFTEKLRNAIEAVDDGGVVCIPSGEYDIEITGNDSIGIHKDVTILGVGRERPSLSIYSGGTVFAITPYSYSGGSTGSISVQMENVNFDCQTDCTLFRCVSDCGPIDFRLLDCDIRGRNVLITAYSARNFKVERCHFKAYTYIEAHYEEWNYRNNEFVEILDSDIYGNIDFGYSVDKILIQGSTVYADEERSNWGAVHCPKVSNMQIIDSKIDESTDTNPPSMIIDEIGALYIDRSDLPIIRFDHISNAYVANSTGYYSILVSNSDYSDATSGIDNLVMLGNMLRDSQQNMLIKSGTARVVTDADTYTKEEIDKLLEGYMAKQSQSQPVEAVN